MVDEVATCESNILTWSEVKSAAELAFNIWVGQPELKWAKQAWGILIEAGLATYSTETERCQVIIRFLALAGFYWEFCGVAWEEYSEPEYLYIEWVEKLEISAFHVRQLIRAEPECASDEHEESDEEEYEYGLELGEVECLVNHAREEVVAALWTGFGCDESGLFVSLWRSNRPDIDKDSRPEIKEEDENEDYEDKDNEGYEDEDNEDEDYETDYEILNSLTPQKLSAFEWLTQQCPARLVEETKLQQRSISTQTTEETNSENFKEDTVKADCPFSAKTFELLEQLHKNQNLNFYRTHQEKFNKYVEKPLQKLLFQVSEQLPELITKRISLQNIMFAYPNWQSYYLGFIYSQQANSIENDSNLLDSACFLLYLYKDLLCFGFFIPERSSDKVRFINNCRIYSKRRELVLNNLPNDCLLNRGNKKSYCGESILNWLKEITRKNTAIKNIQATVYLYKKQVLQQSSEQLIEKIVQTFNSLFPLFVLATYDRPSSALREYANPNYQPSLRYQHSSPISKITLRQELILSGENSESSIYVHPYPEPPFTEIVRYIHGQGLCMSEASLRRYYLALRTRKFVVLSGISGTGKTWLTKAFADAVKAEYLLVPVAPNWTTNEDLLGYLSPIDNQYHDTDFSTFLEKAEDEYQQAQAGKRTPRPYHLVLDEMNLARVEYYFAKFLSAMEVRMREGVAQIQLAPKKHVLLPPNLYFIGTVNVDETTHSFADKVYDRAQLIELEAPRQDLDEYLGEVPYREMLMQIWDEVHTVAPFAFRVLDEIKTYVKEAEALDVSWQDALDEQLLQKILPKLKGADDRVGVALQAFVNIVNEKDFPLSHKKATKMLETFNQHGFTSYF